MIINKVSDATKIRAADYTVLTTAVSQAQSGLALDSKQLRLSKPSGAQEINIVRDWRPLNGTYSNDTPAVTGNLYLYDAEGQKIPSWYTDTNHTVHLSAMDISGVPTLDAKKAAGTLFNTDIPCANKPLSVKIIGNTTDSSGYEYATFSIPMGPVPMTDTLLYIKPSFTVANEYHLLTASSPQSVAIHTCTLNWTLGELTISSTERITLPGLPASGNPFEYIRDFAVNNEGYAWQTPWGIRAFAIRKLGASTSSLIVKYTTRPAAFAVPGFVNMNGVVATHHAGTNTSPYSPIAVVAQSSPWTSTPKSVGFGAVNSDGSYARGYLGYVGSSAATEIAIIQAPVIPGYKGCACPKVADGFTGSKDGAIYHLKGNTNVLVEYEPIPPMNTVSWDVETTWEQPYTNWMRAAVANITADQISDFPTVYLRTMISGATAGSTELNRDYNYVPFSNTNFPTSTVLSPYVTGAGGIDRCSTLILCAGTNQMFVADTDRYAHITNRRPVYIKGLNLRKSYTVGLTIEHSQATPCSVSQITSPATGVVLNEIFADTQRAAYPYKLSTTTGLGTSIIQDKPQGWEATLDLAAADWDNTIEPTMFSEDASNPPIVDGSAACLLYAAGTSTYLESSKIPLPLSKCLYIPSAFVTGSSAIPSDVVFVNRCFTTDSSVHPVVSLAAYETVRCRGGHVCKTIDLNADSVAGQDLTVEATYTAYLLASINGVKPSQFVQLNTLSVQFLDSSYAPVVTGGMYRVDKTLRKIDTLVNSENTTKGIYGYHQTNGGAATSVSSTVEMPTGTRYIRVNISSGIWSNNGRLPADAKSQPGLAGALAIHTLKASVI